MKTLERIGFIGGGNMAEALIKGLGSLATTRVEMLVAEPDAVRRAFLRERYQVEVTADNEELARRCEVLVLAVKPQVVARVLPEIAAAFSDAKLLISIAAGVSIATLEEYFDGRPRVVRVMPNTPALVGAGAAGLSAGRFAADEDVRLTHELFSSVGVVREVSEESLDAVTGLSGSGPAFVYTVIEALADAGVHEGLSRDTALNLAAQTVLGGARMVLESGEHPAVLRDRVYSPGGTTIAGMAALEEGGLRAVLGRAVRAASARSRELGRRA